MLATRRRLCAALVALGCAVGVAACGDDDEPTDAGAGAVRARPSPTSSPSRRSCSTTPSSSRPTPRSSARVPRSTTRWPRPRASTTRSCCGTSAAEVAAVRQAGAGRLRGRQPGVRGDGGRRRRRPVARRLRRDHRRGRRRVRPGERGPDQPEDAGRQVVRPAGQLQLPDRDLGLRHRAEVRRQGRRARPRRRRQGDVRRGHAGRRLLRHRRARVREDGGRARHGREGVDADRRRTRSPRSSS